VSNVEENRDDLLQRLIEQIFCAMRQIHRGIGPRESLLSPPQARLLFAIAGKKELGVSAKELAEKTSVTPGAITQFVDTLVKKDLVRRYEDPNDRRIARIVLTEGARNRLGQFRRDFLASACRAFESLSDDEIRQLSGLLAKVGGGSSPVRSQEME
jgi:DNA-binding MarR family transcriptional regulator